MNVGRSAAIEAAVVTAQKEPVGCAAAAARRASQEYGTWPAVAVGCSAGVLLVLGDVVESLEHGAVRAEAREDLKQAGLQRGAA